MLFLLALVNLAIFPLIFKGGVSLLPVELKPTQVTVDEGMPVKMICSWNVTQVIMRLSVTWNNINNSWSFLHMYNQTNKHEHKTEGNKEGTISGTNATMHIINTTMNDSGLYQCEVRIDIPAPLLKGKSNWIELLVQKRFRTNSGLSVVTVSIIAVSVGLMVVFIVVAVCRWLRNYTSSKGENPIYENQRTVKIKKQRMKGSHTKEHKEISRQKVAARRNPKSDSLPSPDSSSHIYINSRDLKKHPFPGNKTKVVTHKKKVSLPHEERSKDIIEDIAPNV
ncbi:uncharacterized protein LOC114652621 [Erpetoichthys calabaricus]|uniref:uncharacterized protein LOC114652621 n=1 Tax=Erpetoichthys calabaricus TaxID=27687 RepID=UPI0010A056F0|nr:uncharacterized protein LOC114652621 [Erpetoichthys calabaricus]